MVRFGSYLRLFIKRDIKAVPFFFAVIVPVCAALMLLSCSIIKARQSGEEYTRFIIGIVGDTEESYLGWGIDAVRSFDSSRISIDFRDMSEREAVSLLKSGDIYAYIRIPDDFVSSAVKGELKSMEYVTVSAPTGISALVKDEVLATVSEIVKNTEKGIYGCYSAVYSSGSSDPGAATDLLAVKYLDTVMSRSEIYDIEITGVSDELPYTLYYLCGFSVLFISISGLGLCALFSRRYTGLHRLKAAKGMGAAAQTAAEYAAFLLVQLITVIPVLAAAVAFFMAAEVLSVTEHGAAVRFIICAAFGLMCLSALQFLIYEAVGGMVNRMIIQFIGFAGMCYICGCFYPISFFPAPIIKLSSFLPVGIVRELLSAALSGGSPGRAAAGTAVFTAVFLAASAWVRNRRINGKYGDL